MIIGLLRHGESEANVRGLLSSNPTDNFHLTELGKEQIRSISGDEFFVQPPVALYSSPFFRTLETASIIQANVRVLTTIDSRISEMNYGKYSNRPIQETDTEVKETFRRAFSGDFLIKMSETGESRKQFFLRTYSFLISLLKQYNENDRVLVITHSSVIAVLEKLWIRLINPSFIRESTKNAQLKQLIIHKEDVKLVQQEINNLLFSKAHNDSQYMHLTEQTLTEFVPSVAHNQRDKYAIIFNLPSNHFYTMPVKKTSTTDLWLAGTLRTTHLFSKELETLIVFGSSWLQSSSKERLDGENLKYVADYCQKFYPVDQ